LEEDVVREREWPLGRDVCMRGRTLRSESGPACKIVHGESESGHGIREGKDGLVRVRVCMRGRA